MRKIYYDDLAATVLIEPEKEVAAKLVETFYDSNAFADACREAIETSALSKHQVEKLIIDRYEDPEGTLTKLQTWANQ